MSDVRGLAQEAYVPCVSGFSCRIVSVFGTGKIQGGQDQSFLFQGGLASYKAHYIYPTLGHSLEVMVLRPAV
jgi:hypothetical protein